MVIRSDMKISRNRAAIEQLKEQATEETFIQVKCPKCGTSPRLRPAKRYFCKCGELEGVVTK
jgi:hypothetical protein